MVTKKRHFVFFMVNSAIWLIFYLVGLLNDHYQAWPLNAQVVHCVDLVLLIVPLVYVLLRYASQEQYFKDSLWLAFYGSVPYVVYDYLYLGLIKGLGFSYFFSYWYLTIFYFIAWIEIPPIGWVMQKKLRNVVHTA